MKSKILILFILSMLSCNRKTEEQAFYPKPKGFARIELPAHKYQELQEGYPFSFEYSEAAEILPDTSPEAEPYWIKVNYPSLNAFIQFTYKPLNGDLKKLDAHVMDAYRLAAKHQVRAISQKEQIVSLKNGKKAVQIEIEGEVPSHYQFYITDTSKHYLRGAVYLKYATMNDSLKPIVEYLKIDAKEILETLKWKN